MGGIQDTIIVLNEPNLESGITRGVFQLPLQLGCPMVPVYLGGFPKWAELQGSNSTINWSKIIRIETLISIFWLELEKGRTLRKWERELLNLRICKRSVNAAINQHKGIHFLCLSYNVKFFVDFWSRISIQKRKMKYISSCQSSQLIRGA